MPSAPNPDIGKVHVADRLDLERFFKRRIPDSSNYLPIPYQERTAPVGPIVIAAVYTGLRKSDILDLKWRDIDLKKGLIRLEEAKTGKTRNIVLNSDMITLLQSLPVKCQYVFPNKHGKPFKDIKRSFETALKEAKIEQSDDRRYKIVFHTLRHTCVSLLTERGADTTAVNNYVAHASEEMTKHYTHLSEEYARSPAEILNGLCGVIPVHGNNLETMTKNEKVAKNPSLASA